MFAVLAKFHELRCFQSPSHSLPLHTLETPFFFASHSPLYLPAFPSFHRFTDLVFVGYTADGYKKGLCHETPTADELAGAMQLGVGFTSVVVRQLVLRDLLIAYSGVRALVGSPHILIRAGQRLPQPQRQAILCSTPTFIISQLLTVFLSVFRHFVLNQSSRLPLSTLSWAALVACINHSRHKL